MSSNSNDDSSNENTCVVCFKNVDIFSVGDCDHPVCYECSTRMRVLCRQNECPICRHDMQRVIFTRSVRPFKQLERSLSLRTAVDRKFQIVFESPDIQAAYDALLAHVCPKCPTRHAFQTFNHLRDHVRKEHELFYCDLCVDNLKILTRERKCYSRRDLALHRRQGDADDRSHRGHPLCEFCDRRYNDNDELYRHLRRDHLFCHFCDADGLHQYYDSYDVLRNHFRDQHYLCEEGECYEEKFTPAFRTEIDLKAHRASVHGRQMSKAAAKQARTLELAFTLKPRPRQTDHRRGGGRSSRYQNSHSDEEEGAVGGVAVDCRTSQQTTSAPSFSKINTASTDDFPSLGGSVGASSLQGVHFRKPGVTIRTGGGLAIREEDFPALGPDGAASVSLRVNTTGSAAERARNKPNVSIHVNHRPVALSRPRDPFPALANDFPALSMKTSAQNTSQWTAKETRDEPKFALKTKPQVQPYQKAKENQQKAKENQPKAKEKKMMFDDDSYEQNDFPALKGNVPSHIANLASTQWSSGREPEAKFTVNKNSNQPQPPPKPPQPKKFHIEDDFPSLNSRFDASCSFSQEVNGKKKKDVTPAQSENDWTKVVKGNDNISSDSEVNGKKGKKKKAKSKKEPEVKSKVSNTNNSSEKKKHKGDESLQSSEKPKNKEKKRTELTIESLNGHSQPESSINSNDFPTLNSNRLPPGFSHEDKPSAPPGFDSVPAPPPGFSITLNSVARPPSNSLTFTSSSGQNYPISPTGEVKRVYSYVAPVDMKRRNTNLVQRVTEVLKTKQALDEFLQMSALFRQDTINAQTYYEHCKQAMGDKFLEVFPELLVLLPDINKQQELWKVAERRKEWRLQVCAVCSQVVATSEFKLHHTTHSLDNHFPTLSNGVTSTSNAWKK
ncbi:E3 ubiquitin-protein ligase ZNF598-like [Macrosteles quadrilineatus]|uniref:E3 ubiquitin-protein ligase ZNF598-like n=1 Tax=Macrosteles quadrilineatus TaxID=74068 RepID=UPI0023E1D5FA|nr:E3 ubiquitin-protein ligase ZNF598-like [Macrosteles quadrilineatus]